MSILYLASYLTTNPLISQSRFIEPREFPEASSARTLGNSFKILAEVEFTGSAQGVIVSQGSRFGGYTLFVKNGKLIFIYNFLGIEEQRLVAEAHYWQTLRRRAVCEERVSDQITKPKVS